MKFSEIIEISKQVLDSLRANKMRSTLSSLGVVIGISVVILMGYLINGLDLVMEEAFNVLGTDMLYIDKYDWSGGKSWDLVRQRKNITLEQSEDFRKSIKTAELAVPVVRIWGTNAKYGNDYFDGIIVQGTLSEYAQTSAGEIEQGRFFSEFEDRMSENVIVLGHKVWETIFPNNDGLGKIIKIKGKHFRVIGKIAKRGILFVDMMDNMCFIPLNTFIGTFGKYGRSISIAVKAGSTDKMDEVRYESIGLMRAIRNLSPRDEDDFSINESKTFQNSVNTLRLYVWSIGIGMTALSFIVGIIGIMNIMFVSVTERTKEIGIRKAMGATKASILVQFILESMLLCFIGAVVSFVACSALILVFSLTIPVYVEDLTFLPKYLPANLFIIATFVSLFVGIMAGLIPSLRAANLDPVDALRFE